MTLDKIYRVSAQGQRVLAHDIRAAERKLGAVFPDGYSEYMRRFGEGEYCDFLVVYPPTRILTELVKQRDLLRHGVKEGYWDRGEVQIGEHDADGMIPLADTIDGDMFAFAPSGDITMFPRQENRLHRAGESLSELLEFAGKHCSLSGSWFQPWCDTAMLRMHFLDNAAPPSVEHVSTLFAQVGKATYSVRDETSVDHFIRRYGAHLQYLHLPDQGYVQFISKCNKDSAARFFPRLAKAVKNESFEVAERYDVPSQLLR